MDAPDDDAPDARPPRLSDLVSLCRRLNDEAARYVVIGGMAIIQAGFVRATEDVDLLVDAAPDNVASLRRALRSLPDRAVDDMADGDLDTYVVVRVADEIVVDLMKAACGVEYADAAGMVDVITIDGVPIPFASPRLLWRTKQTFRDKDRLDRAFLQSMLTPEESS
jgi:hypothetical protein